MVMTFRNVAARTLAATALVLAATGAHAALVTCPTSYVTDPTSKVVSATGNTAVSACQRIDTVDSGNVANIGNINSAGFFGFDDWETNGQTQINGGSALSGTWSIANANFSLYDYIIVFKGGQTNLIAFLFNEDYTSGGWSSPLDAKVWNPSFGNPNKTTQFQGVSHFSIARRSNPSQDVPEPGSLALLGLGLLGAGALRRLRRTT